MSGASLFASRDVNATQSTVAIPASDLVNAGSASLTVVNPGASLQHHLHHN
jgi:hypothetical protein